MIIFDKYTKIMGTVEGILEDHRYKYLYKVRWEDNSKGKYTDFIFNMCFVEIKKDPKYCRLLYG